MLFQIVYLSRAGDGFDPDSLDELLALARARNAEQDITGMLLYSEGSFIQVLEGPEQAVQNTFSKIEKDTRHREVKVVLRTHVDERAFAEWSMGF